MPLPSTRARRRAIARAFAASRVAEQRYTAELRAIVADIHQRTVKFLSPHLRDMVRGDSEKWFSGDFDLFNVGVVAEIPQRVAPAYDRMAATTKLANGRAMTLAGIRVADMRLGAELSRRREENIRLVENAQRDYAASVRAVFEDPDANTWTIDTLVERLEERGEVSGWRAELIARDQVLSVNAGITEIRQTNAGIEEYDWSTSGDERVRDEHVVLDGQRFSWAAGHPTEGHPGSAILCRCVAIPFIPELADLSS